MNGIAPLHQPCGEGAKGTKVKHRIVTEGDRIGAREAARLKLSRGFKIILYLITELHMALKKAVLAQCGRSGGKG